MNRTPLVTASLGSLVALALALPSPGATAATSTRSIEHTAAGMCVPATFTVAKVRNRPSGVRNESTQTLYVTCSEPGAWTGTGQANDYHLQLGNASAASLTINCTLFTGYPNQDMSNATSQGTYPKSISLAPNSSDFIAWESSDLTGSVDSLLNASWSCALPPGAEVKAVWRRYKVDIGA